MRPVRLFRRPPKLTVFEASNPARREVFVGATPLAMSALIASFREAFPPQLRHWRPREEVTYRSLEFGLSAARAAAFVRKYAAGPRGWRVIRARPRGGAKPR